jgi:hypothetical protein
MDGPQCRHGERDAGRSIFESRREACLFQGPPENTVKEQGGRDVHKHVDYVVSKRIEPAQCVIAGKRKHGNRSHACCGKGKVAYPWIVYDFVYVVEDKNTMDATSMRKYTDGDNQN